MSPLGSEPSDYRELAILGNAENRRVTEWLQAAAELRLPPPKVLPYQLLLEQPELLAGLSGYLLRLDSPGQNETVAKSLIALGGGPPSARLEHGEIAYLRSYHQGFVRLLRRVARARIPCLNHPEEVATMFDKWACHRLFARQGLARPPAYLAPSSFAELRDQMGPHGRLFLKPLHGSSASGVCALRWASKRVQMLAPLRLQNGRLFNSLRVHSYERLSEIEQILDRLLPEAMIAERWIPKLALEGGVVDLRVLVIAGQARHVVARQSHHPMTNLHLGNRRGNLEQVRAHLGSERWQEAICMAQRAAACFPRCLYAGVDILLDRWGKALVGEINAFGDLLPGLTDRGESTSVAILRSSRALWRIQP